MGSTRSLRLACQYTQRPSVKQAAHPAALALQLADDALRAGLDLGLRSLDVQRGPLALAIHHDPVAHRQAPSRVGVKLANPLNNPKL